jgi:hypothetical protein
MARRAIRRATQHQTRWRQHEPQFLAFCPSDLPVKKSRSRRVAGNRPEASAIQAAVWQPKM